MMGMVEELERAQLGVKLEDRWCEALVYLDNVVLVADWDGGSDCGRSFKSMW